MNNNSSSCVFVTSFKPDMYTATGKHLLDSFGSYCNDAEMFACVEEFGESVPQTRPHVSFYDITADDMLLEWLRSNTDLIPKHLGGAAEPCNCPVTGFGIEETHRAGCSYCWYNRNAARWFRKLVALKCACRNFPNRKLIWIDSDCRFKADLYGKTIASWFQNCSGFYFKSPQRKVLESGILGLDLGIAGSEFIRAVIERYMSGEFRQDLRWDDGYQIQMVINQRTDIELTDLAPTALPWHAEVIATSQVGRYIEHYRGTHGPVLRLMT